MLKARLPSLAKIAPLLISLFAAPAGAQETMQILQHRPSVDLSTSVGASIAARVPDYSPLLSSCAQSLAHAAQGSGVLTHHRIDDPGKWREVLSVEPDTTYRITLMVPNRVVRLNSGGGAILLPGAFTSAGHFASFLDSPLLRWMRDRPLQPASADTLLPAPLQLAGLAYGTALHLVAPDQLLSRPHQLADRTSIAPFGMDGMIGAKHYISADLRQRLPGQLQPDEVVIQVPLILLRESVHQSLRKFLGFSVTRIVPILFVVDYTNRLNAKQRERINALVHKAALQCSAINYDLETREIAALQREGTQVAEVDRPAFRAASLFFQKDRLEGFIGDDRSKRELELELEVFEKLASPDTADPPAPERDLPPPSPAAFTFKVCNSKAFVINVAYVGAPVGGDRRIKGWLSVQPKSCREIGKFKTGDFHFFAQTFNTNPIQVFVNAGSKLSKFCVGEKTFDFPPERACRSDQKRDFSLLHVTNDNLSWNL